jgi:hypothetical protein
MRAYKSMRSEKQAVRNGSFLYPKVFCKLLQYMIAASKIRIASAGDVPYLWR